MLRHNRFVLNFLFPYRAWRYAETRIASFDRLDEIRAKKPTDVGVCQSRSHSITLRQENVVKRRCEKVKIPRMRCSIIWDSMCVGRQSTGQRILYIYRRMCEGKNRRKSRYFQTIFTETIGLCGPYDEILGTRHRQRYFGCLNSCQEVVLHVSHLMDLLDSSRRGGVVRQLTRDRALFLLLSLRQRLC